LQVGPQESVAYRHARLRCGDHVVSESDIWYVPSRLPPEMRRTLETTAEPFTAVIKPLAPFQRTFDSQMLWPAPGAAETRPAAHFMHRTLFYDQNNLSFAEVDDLYLPGLLDFLAAPISE
jgi:hypothetical protein